MKLWRTFNVQRREDISYYDTSGEFEAEQFAMHLNRLILEEMQEKGKDGVMFLCIGTDRSTGDSLGPLIGHKLRRRRLKRAAVIGTLERPVHAMNLDMYAEYIRMHYPDYVIVAIDASVGSSDHVGFATLGRGALRPGLGVSKKLDAVGDISITGIVGGSANRDPVMLQSVRLSMVMKMADCICEGICLVERFWENAAII
ncbi:MAG: spore protease YyaC [Enterocloster sp.]